MNDSIPSNEPLYRTSLDRDTRRVLDRLLDCFREIFLFLDFFRDISFNLQNKKNVAVSVSRPGHGDVRELPSEKHCAAEHLTTQRYSTGVHRDPLERQL